MSIIDDELDALRYSLYVGRGNGKTMFNAKLMYAIAKAKEEKNMETHFTPKSIEQSADHKTVVVIWTDNTKTIVHLSPNDPDDIYMAFTAALAKKIFGSNSKIKKVISTHLNEHKPKKKKTEEES